MHIEVLFLEFNVLYNYRITLTLSKDILKLVFLKPRNMELAKIYFHILARNINLLYTYISSLSKTHW